MTLEAALTEAMRDLWDIDDPYYGSMNIVALDAEGNPGAASNVDRTYIYMTDAMEAYVEAPRLKIARPEGGN
jgi:hypothetical protein